INQLSPRTNDTLTVTVTSHDNDGESVSYAYQWLKNGAGISGATDSTLSLATTGNGDKGDGISVRATPTAAGVTGSAQTSAAVAVANSAPVAQDLSVNTNEATDLPVTLAASDVDTDPLTFTVLSGPSHGTLTGSGASLTYRPASNNNGSDSFSYKAGDGSLDSYVATVAITVNAVNDVPVANGQSVSTNEDTDLPVTLTGSDVEGDSLSFVVVGGPTHGTLLGTGANLTY